ncbi:MAG TPA: helix-turn-helix domain-containing protein [Acidimicrobiia bacterium]|nr:helix-turn-helix domain-containing protein [Acidimicrobiia bacterium]
MGESDIVRLRGQISNLHSLFVLSMMMTESRDEDEILSLAVTSVASLGPCTTEGAYRPSPDGTGELDRFREPAGRRRKATVAALAALGVDDGPVEVAGRPWGWAFALRSLGGHWGYLVVGAPAEPTADEQFLLKVLAHQTGSALENAALHRRERAGAAELRRVNAELASVNGQLAATVADLERTATIHEALSRVSASGAGEEGIARTVWELTGYPVAVEDRFGNLRAWAGPGRPDPYPKPDARRRAQLLRQARREGRPLRAGDRLWGLAQPRDEILGVVSLLDPDGTAGPHEAFALEHGALVLAAELSHLRALGEMELRLRGDLVDDLCTGTDDESARARAEAIGYDLHRPHQVVVVQGRGRATGETLARAVEQAAAGLEIGSLIGRRQGAVVLLAHRPESRAAEGSAAEGSAAAGPAPAREAQRWTEFAEALAAALPPGPVAVGVGGRCDRPSDFPRSTREAFVALGVRQASRQPAGLTTYDSLGIYRILAGGEHTDEVEAFVREWLGPLLDYDAAHRAELVKTLSTYLECGGNYDETADGLAIHRSTLRYRLQRIREVSGLDLAGVDVRFNLHAATRAWRVLGL